MTPETTNRPSGLARLLLARTASALCVALALLVGAGCEPGMSLAPIEDVHDFQRQVIEADGPVLVEFYKTSCPTCVIQEDQLAQLATEYTGRVTFAKFLIKDLSWSSTAPTLEERYNLLWVPTTILFVDGQERQRWELNHLPSEFRLALNELVGPADPRPAPAATVMAATPALAATPAVAAAAPAPAATAPYQPPVAQWPGEQSNDERSNDEKCEDGLGCRIDRRDHQK